MDAQCVRQGAGCDRSRHLALAPLATVSNSSRRSRPLHRVSTTSRVARRRRQLFYRPVDVENSLFDRGVLDVVQVFFKRTVLHHRSEEHTSELQSLMSISYAVFCLKKNT